MGKVSVGRLFSRLLFFVSIAATIIGIYIVNQLNLEYQYFKNNSTNTNFIEVLDCLDDSFQEVIHRPEILKDLDLVNKLLHESKEFDFIEVRTTAPIFIKEDEYPGTKEFAWENDFILDGYCRVLSVQLGQSAFDHFDITMSEGTIFTSDDYASGNFSNIPILLGSDYRGLYQMGDTLSFSVGMQDYTGYIIGFLNAGSNIVRFNQAVCLDKYMIMPFQNISIPMQIPSNVQDTSQLPDLLDKNNGVLFPLSSIEDVENRIQTISQTTNLEYRTSISYQKIEAEYLCGMLISITLVTGFIGYIGIYIVCKRRNTRNKKCKVES